ncbi:MAG: hypothetical protein IKQ92_09850 [Clostridia bacterium]|nr:hypothetical protein [Clostridia bacterium]
MTDFWVLSSEPSPASAALTSDALILENRYLRRVIGRGAGVTVSLSDGDGTEAIAGPVREGAVTVDGVPYALEGPCEIRVRPGHETEKKFDYAPKPYSSHVFPYPAPGKVAELIYTRGTLDFTVIYEIFDGMPVLRKSLYVKNNGEKTVTVNAAETEALRLNDEGRLRLYLESDYTGSNGSGFSTETSLFHDGEVVSARFDMGPDADIEPGGVFRGMQVYELFCQSVCFDHRMNEIQNMYRRVAPWVCEAPMFLHLISDDSGVIRESADILADAGFDMIVQSFGSGINLESEDPLYIARVKSDYDYVHAKGLAIGGYTLAIIRDYSPMNHDCATNGDHSQISRCLATKWSEGYWDRIVNFLEKTGSDFIEIDGPYHFYTCTGNRPGQTEHLHKGLSDSRYRQWLKSTVEIYIRLRRLGVYVNTPDWFYLSGTNKCAVGYEEIAFSRPRREQLLLTRIYNYMGTYHKTPSMGWGFLPVDIYHGGGDAAKFEPLTEHLAEYDWAIATAAASGVWPCVRGRRAYDSELCRAVVKYWTGVIRKHRKLLNSNTVHVCPPRPTEDLSLAADMDVILQENHDTPDRLFLAVFNQTDTERTKTFLLPAFYTGLTGLERPHTAPRSGSFDDVVIPSFGSWPPTYPKNRENLLEDAAPAPLSGIRMVLYEHDLPGKRTECPIDENGNLILTVTLPPQSYTFFVGYAPDEGPSDPIPVPEGKPFGLPRKTEDAQKVAETRKIDFGALAKADSVPAILKALGLPEDSGSFDGNAVLLRAETYGKIHDFLRALCPENAANLMFALAHTGIHTTADPAVPEDEVLLLEGWKRDAE